MIFRLSGLFSRDIQRQNGNAVCKFILIGD